MLQLAQAYSMVVSTEVSTRLADEGATAMAKSVAEYESGDLHDVVKLVPNVVPAQPVQGHTVKNRWDTAVVLDNGIRIQIGVSDRYVGQSDPRVDTGADRTRPFGIPEIRMLFGRR